MVLGDVWGGNHPLYSKIKLSHKGEPKPARGGQGAESSTKKHPATIIKLPSAVRPPSAPDHLGQTGKRPATETFEIVRKIVKTENRNQIGKPKIKREKLRTRGDGREPEGRDDDDGSSVDGDSEIGDDVEVDAHENERPHVDRAAVQRRADRRAEAQRAADEQGRAEAHRAQIREEQAMAAHRLDVQAEHARHLRQMNHAHAQAAQQAQAEHTAKLAEMRRQHEAEMTAAQEASAAAHAARKASNPPPQAFPDRAAPAAPPVVPQAQPVPARGLRAAHLDTPPRPPPEPQNRPMTAPARVGLFRGQKRKELSNVLLNPKPVHEWPAEEGEFPQTLRMRRHERVARELFPSTKPGHNRPPIVTASLSESAPMDDHTSATSHSDDDLEEPAGISYNQHAWISRLQKHNLIPQWNNAKHKATREPDFALHLHSGQKISGPDFKRIMRDKGSASQPMQGPTATTHMPRDPSGRFLPRK